MTRDLSNLKRVLHLNALLPENLAVPKDKVLALYDSEVSPTDYNGQTVFRDANGNEYRNPKTLEPLPEHEVLSQWLASNNFIKSNDDNRGLSSIRTTADFYQYCEVHSIPPSKQRDILLEVQSMDPNFRLT